MEVEEILAHETLAPGVRTVLADASGFLIDEWLDDLGNVEIDPTGHYEFAAVMAGWLIRAVECPYAARW